jgi:hypothetical protein
LDNAELAAAPLRQRADYTYKPNLKTGRHGWLRLTPAYSVKVVDELIDQCGQCGTRMRIFDPFCGTATTALSAATHGHDACTTDINPFLVWFGRAKTAHYKGDEIADALGGAHRALDLIAGKTVPPVPAPPLHNIERWWSPTSLAFLTALRAAIDAAQKPPSPSHTLLTVAFCRTLIALSNAAFNHQSMSFKSRGNLPVGPAQDMSAMFLADVKSVLTGAADNPRGTAQIHYGDARNPSAVVDGPFDRVITSPPYVNRMSYIRELRPYMYWLGFLTTGRDAGELDWTAIGGTWGIATSRLIGWEQPSEHFSDPALDTALERIAGRDNKSGRVLANYVAKYFNDMWAHFNGLTPILAPNAEVHYIVGNSTFYGVLLPVERLYAVMLARLGFTNIECRAIRKRNSKKELVEFDVTARWRS